MATLTAFIASPAILSLSRSRFSGTRFIGPIRIQCVSSSSSPSSSVVSSKKASFLEKPPVETKVPLHPQSGTSQWRFQDNAVNVYYEENKEEGASNAKNILMVPTISDVSTVEEWRTVAKDIVMRKGETDWPGLGYSD